MTMGYNHAREESYHLARIPSLSQQPSGEDTMITSLTEGYTEASSWKTTGTWDEGVIAKYGGISPNLKGAAAWLAGWLGHHYATAGAGSAKAAVPERQDTEALRRLDTGACGPMLIVHFLPQVCKWNYFMKVIVMQILPPMLRDK